MNRLWKAGRSCRHSARKSRDVRKRKRQATIHLPTPRSRHVRSDMGSRKDRFFQRSLPAGDLTIYPSKYNVTALQRAGGASQRQGESMLRMPSQWLVAICGFGVSALVAGQASAGPTTQFTVTGDVVAPATYTLATLEALPPTTETVTFQTMSGPQTGSFTGPTLWTLLNTVGLQTPAV